MSLLENIRVFVRVVEQDSMSAAGRQLRLSPAVVSHRIQALESEPEGKGGKVKITFNEQIIVSDSWMIPKGAPNKELAMKAIAIMSRPEVNARISN